MIKATKEDTKKNVYEIYICGGPEMTTGWEILFVSATPDGINSYPNFDCIISVNEWDNSSQKIINWI